MSYQDVFERYEYKFFLTPSQKKELLEETKDRLVLDQYGRTTIRNILGIFSVIILLLMLRLNHSCLISMMM